MNCAKRLVLLACLLAPVRPGAAQPVYTVVAIPPPMIGDTRYSAGLALNERGEVAGEYTLFLESGGSRHRAFSYSAAMESFDLGFAPSWDLFAEGINNHGQVTVYGGLPGTPVQAFRFTPELGFEPLGSLGGTQTEADGINNAGQVTGFSSTADGREHAYRYTDGIGMVDIGMAFNNSRGFSINDFGWVAGWADGNAIVFRDAGNINLGPGLAYGINNVGDVAGRTFVVPGHPTAFVYRNGELLILSDEVFGDAALLDINNNGLAVGVGTVGVFQTALFWSYSPVSGGLVDLNSLIPPESGWYLIVAAAINDAGQITGTGIFNGEPMGYRLDLIQSIAITAQPESRVVPAGQEVSFAVAVTGTSPAFEWRFNDTPILGATNSTLNLHVSSTAQAGNYTVVATNWISAVTSSVATLQVLTSPPVFRRQPHTQAVRAGRPVRLSAWAVGAPPPAYQWFFDGAPIPGATNATHIIPSMTSAHNGRYAVQARNEAGAVTSRTALVKVIPPHSHGR